MTDKKQFYEDMQKILEDVAICIRCKGPMYLMPADPQPGVDNSVKVYACTKCGKIEPYMEVKKDENKK